MAKNALNRGAVRQNRVMKGLPGAKGLLFGSLAVQKRFLKKQWQVSAPQAIGTSGNNNIYNVTKSWQTGVQQFEREKRERAPTRPSRSMTVPVSETGTQSGKTM